MRNSINQETETEPNFWLRQAAEFERAEIEADAQFLLETRTAAKADHNYWFTAFLIIWWLGWVTVCVWKTLPGGIAAVPTFLILLAIGTTVSITAAVQTR